MRRKDVCDVCTGGDRAMFAMFHELEEEGKERDGYSLPRYLILGVDWLESVKGVLNCGVER